MRKLLLFISIMFLLLSAGCKKDNNSETYKFNAKVLEIYENSILTEPIEDEKEKLSSDKISFSTANLEDIGVAVGDIVTIEYNGKIAESYPAQITALSWFIYEKANESTEDDGSSFPEATNITDSFEDVKNMFAAYGNKPDASRLDIPFFDSAKKDYDVWYNFYSNVSKGERDAIIIADYTTEGDAVLTYAAYTGDKFYIAKDYSRDEFGAGEPYTESEYQYIKEYIYKSTVSYYFVNNSSLAYKEIMDGYLSSMLNAMPDCAFLTSFNADEVSKYIYEDLPLVSAYIKPESVSVKGLVLTVQNDEDRNASFGASYQLEKKSGGAWENCEYISPESGIGWDDIEYPVLAKSSSEFTINWESLYGSLIPGEYRIEKSFSMEGDQDMLYTVYAEFTIDEYAKD
ncbi:MAG: immunoglobulin-like domain-containing protein [Lachnospiraceae bacterium]|nr:immunoglobulin-like domain-containing protein [Lachnospiraceae bacterium]